MSRRTVDSVRQPSDRERARRCGSGETQRDSLPGSAAKQTEADGSTPAIDLAHPARGLEGFAPVSSSPASPDGSPGEASTPPDVHRERTVQVHNPRYDFNGDALAIGASYWVMRAEQQLPASGSRPPS